MRVLMKVSQAGHNFSRRKGYEYDLPDEVAKNLIKTGQATPSPLRDGRGAPETASLRPGQETTMRKRGRPRKTE